MAFFPLDTGRLRLAPKRDRHLMRCCSPSIWPSPSNSSAPTGPISACTTSPASSALRSRCWQPLVPGRADRDRRGGRRHALREPDVRGRNAGAGRPPVGGRLQLGISVAHQNQSSTAGATSATSRPRARPTLTSPSDIGEVFLDVLRGQGFARPNPRPMFPNPPASSPRAVLGRPARAHLVGCGDQCYHRVGSQARHEPAKLDIEIRRTTSLPHPAGRADPRLPAQPGRRPVTSAHHVSRSAAASSPSSMTVMARTSAAARTRTISASSSPKSGRSSAAATPTNPMPSSSNSPKTRPSRRPTHCS